ncbi:MAG: YggT family protein [Deltaproteobacteria bacterium]|nr:YggT family protein [Deltaproteobacteria bacterium]
MFILANFIDALAVVTSWALTLYMYVIVIRALISWVNPDPYNPVVQFLYRATEPALKFVRKKLPNMGGVDIAPLVVILIIIFLQAFLVNTLHQLAFMIGSYSGPSSGTGSGGLQL